MLLLLATLALWVRGYWVRDGIWYSTDTARYSIHSHHGRIWFWSLSGGRVASSYVMITAAKLHRGVVWDSTPDSYCYQFIKRPKWSRIDIGGYTIEAPACGYLAAVPGAVDWRALGFRYLQNNSWLPIAQLQWGYPTARSTAIFIPHWAIALLLAILPAVWLGRELRRRYRVRNGLCRVCGYDLRASPERCPECGAVAGRFEVLG